MKAPTTMEGLQRWVSKLRSGKPKRHIMLVAMQSSIHVGRWLELVDRSEHRITMFPINGLPPNDLIADVDVLVPRLDGETAGHAESGPEYPFVVRFPLRACGLALGQLFKPDSIGGADRHRRRPLILRRPRRAFGYARACLLYGVSNPVHIPRQLGLRDFVKSIRRLWMPTPRPTVRSVDLPVKLSEFMGTDPRTDLTVRLGESDQTTSTMFGPHVLAAAIKTIQPDVIHSMEFQHCGYLVLAAKDLLKSNFPTWIATNWGSDIYYYERFADHRRQIVRLLSSIDCYSAECHRDVKIARGLGYRGPSLPVVPASGGLDLARCQQLRSPGKPSQRRLIMMKGYDHFAGRALTTLDILCRNADLLSNYEIVCLSLTPNTREAIERVQQERRLNIRILAGVPYDEVLAHYGQARVYIGLGVSDAISTAVLESMAMGCFPIQTNTSCCNEWIDDGVGGFIVSLDDIADIERKLRRALQDDELVDRAADINWDAACRRLDSGVVERQVAAFYDSLMAASTAKRGSAPS